MRSVEIRQKFFDFFSDKGHKIVASAPIVNNSDPTLMFTNAGMNQFKDNFLGTKEIIHSRVADTQKCLRVSGKHNDLEEVGLDSYHHTMFEMLGNWSFGDYFKSEAIDWAWELLTKVYGLDGNRLYATIFEGASEDALERDVEAFDLWKKHLPEDRILNGSKKDNFWEMGESGPCGPCSEIHIDLRSEEERAAISGADLVNQDHPLVIEVWNLVFIQFNRLLSGQLEPLPQNHVDTGMGFERLCMAIQGKKSNYETDVFTPFIHEIEKITGFTYSNQYSEEAKVDTSFRVVVDHIRAVAFTIADGQIPGNTGAGYVIRRILRRAVRYYYTFLNWQQPLMYQLIPMLADYFADVFPELQAQKDFVAKVILEEEKGFLRTLEEGIQRFNLLTIENNQVAGEDAFTLYDTFGFPIDLTALMAKEKGYTVDLDGFNTALSQQKERSRKDAVQQVGDWNIVSDVKSTVFKGYDHDSLEGVKVTRMRSVAKKDKEILQLVLDQTPFYAEGGGQIGDRGRLTSANGEVIAVLNTLRENELIVHIVDRFPSDVHGSLKAEIDVTRRKSIENNHSATHLLHAALRQVLGSHVQQKGSLVTDKYLRFDFSHYEKLSTEELAQIESIVQEKITANIPLQEDRSIPIAEAQAKGAMMLFGEKYGDTVRMITFEEDYSRELCGGCHVDATGNLQLFRITSESAIAAGIRRIEAVTGSGAIQYVNNEIEELNSIRALFKNTVGLPGQIQKLQEENKGLQKSLEELKLEGSKQLKTELVNKLEAHNDVMLLAECTDGMDGKILKNMVFEIAQLHPSSIIVMGDRSETSAQILIYIDKELVSKYELNAGSLIRSISSYIKGGGGGQAFFATAGGKNPDGVAEAVQHIKDDILTKIKAV
ncbi:alanine--tRNA ligase [Membranihabitans marinus]|uniref:alanine--tRNA ligase n=1 Tax=Membranihabitans marinus TaxID=1227546 RepID=UPI001F020527|nr:alanine--tRNA ligase [Membranihabitans marinus]